MVPVRREPLSTGISLLTGKNTGKIGRNGFSRPLIRPEAQHFRVFDVFPQFQLTGNVVFNNRERAENNREKWVLGYALDLLGELTVSTAKIGRGIARTVRDRHADPL